MSFLSRFALKPHEVMEGVDKETMSFRKREFTMLQVISTIFLSIGMIKVLERLAEVLGFTEVILGMIFLAIGFVLLLFSQNIHWIREKKE